MIAYILCIWLKFLHLVAALIEATVLISGINQLLIYK